MKKVLFALSLMVVLGLQSLLAQTTNITGLVTDAGDGMPIPGVSVFVKGTTVGTITMPDGNYTLEVPSDATTLVFSFVGMTTQEVAIAGQTVINVKLGSDAIAVDEVVVTAYGVTKKESFTGSASVVGQKMLEKTSTSNVSQALQGKAAGVQVVSTTGQPGANATIRVRGIGSLNGSSDPLYVVDGVPYSGYLNSINPSDIENITILKDAASTALYGSRAANGVVMITTKKGKSGKTNVNVSVRHGVNSRAVADYDKIGIEDFYQKSWESYRNSFRFNSKYDSYSDADINSYASGNFIKETVRYNITDVANEQVVLADGTFNPNANILYHPDWEDALLHNGKRSEVNVGFNGGTDKVTYYLGFGYLSDEGIINNGEFERYSGKANVTNEVNDWLKLNFNADFGTSKQNTLTTGGSVSNPFSYIQGVGPIYPIYVMDGKGGYVTDTDGSRIYDFGNALYGLPSRPASVPANSNVIATTDLDSREALLDFVNPQLNVDVKFLKDFTFTSALGINYYARHYTRHQNALYGDAANYKGRTSKYGYRSFNVTWSKRIAYTKQFGDHKVSALVGHENFSRRFNQMTATRTGFPTPEAVELDLAAVNENSGSYQDEYSLESYLSRFAYDYKSRYFAEFSFRADGSSRFHPDNRWGNFWGVSGAWRMSEEDFMAADWLDNLKLKVSYGETGNDRLLKTNGNAQYYAYQSTYDSYPNNGQPGLFAGEYGNDNVTWESNKTLDVGVEMGVFNSTRIALDFFRSNKDDQLYYRQFPLSVGYKGRYENSASMLNKGIEFEISTDIIRNESLSWVFSLNATHITNEVTSLPDDVIQGTTFRWSEGHDMYEYYMYEYAGVDQKTGKELFYADVMDAEGKATGEVLTTDNPSNANRKYLNKSALPDVYGGFDTEVNYKGFDLAIAFAYQFGGYAYDSQYAGLMSPSASGGAWHPDVLDSWSPENPTGAQPRLEWNALTTVSSRYLIKSDYLNLRSVTLGYTLPKTWLAKVNIQSARFYVQGDNLHLWSKRQGLVPYQNLDGINNEVVYSPMRTISVGLNVNL